MDLSDLAGMAPSMNKPELRRHVEEFVQEVRDDPNAMVTHVEGGKMFVAGNGGLGRTTWDIPAILRAAMDPEPETYQTATDLQAFVSSTFNYELDNTGLKQVLRDALGPDLDADTPAIDTAVTRLHNAAKGFATGQVLISIRGMETGAGGVIVDDMRFESGFSRPIHKPLAGMYSITVKDKPIPAHTVITYELTYDPDDPPNYVQYRKPELLRQLLQLYAGDQFGISGIMMDNYGDYPEGHFSDPDGPPTDVFTFNANDGNRFERLVDLLVESREPPSVRNPVSRAFSHLTHSIDEWTSPPESITFALMGLESLYKHYTDYGKSSRDIQRYTGYLLDEVGQSTSATSIRDFLNTEAYDVRNSWVHGQEGGLQQGMFHPTEEQREIWDYLRASIVVFGWIDANTDLMTDGQLPLDTALIDSQTRQQLEEEVAELSLSDFLSIQL